MTALKPIENRRVRGVASERYPLNEKCAHPECVEPTADPHHIFPRSEIGGDSWFVEIIYEPIPGGAQDVFITPHVTGLCRAHHDDVEEHRAWIKLDPDDGYVWYDAVEGFDEDGLRFVDWEALGPLNPQPGSTLSKPKHRKRLQGEARRKRVNITIGVPADREDGAGIWDDTLEQVKEALIAEGLYSGEDRIANYEAIIAALQDWLQGRLPVAHEPFDQEKS